MKKRLRGRKCICGAGGSPHSREAGVMPAQGLRAGRAARILQGATLGWIPRDIGRSGPQLGSAVSASTFLL